MMNKSSNNNNNNNNSQQKKAKNRAKKAKKTSNGEEEESKKETQPTTPTTTTTGVNSPTNQAENILRSKIYEAFFQLSQFDEAARELGVRELSSYFALAESSANLRDYIMSRLIKGLASNRKCSRLGFACALTALFDSSAPLSFDQVLDSANTIFKLNNNNNNNDEKNLLTKEEIRHIQVGLSFVYLSFVQSKRVETASADLLNRLVSDLNSARKNPNTKFYVQQIYLQTLILLVRKMSIDMFQTQTLTLLGEDLRNGVFGADNFKGDFNLALACLNSHPDPTRHFLSKHGDLTSSMASSKTLEYLSQSTETLPKVHPICLELVDYLIKHQVDSLPQFWLTLVDAKLCARKEVEKKYLCHKLFFYLFSKLNEFNFELIFDSCLMKSERLISTLAGNFLNKKSNLNKISKELFKELSELFKVKDAELMNGKSTAGLLVRLIENVRNFYDLSELISAAIPTLNESGVRVVFDYLTGEFADKTIELEDEFREESVANKLAWIVNQFYAMSKNVNTFKDNELMRKILDYLMRSSFFGAKDEKLEAHYREALLKFVGILLSKNEARANLLIVELIESFVKSVEGGMCGRKGRKGGVEMLSEKLAERAGELKVLSGDVVNTLTALNKMLAESERSGEDKHVMQIFFMIITIEYFRMFDTFKSSRQVIRDVEFCIREFTGEKTTNGHAEEVKKLPWIDMTVEMLLNLLTINKHWIRSEVKNQFKKLTPKLTSDSAKLVIDLLAVENDLLEEEEDEMSDEDEEEEEEEDEMEEDANSIDEKKGEKRKLEESEEEEESDEEEEEEENENGPKTALPEIEFSALGGFNGTADSDNESDLNDEQMMQLDDKIAAAFKMRLSEKTNDSLKLQYKLKVLDLVQELFRSSSRLDLVAESIKPMLNVLFESQKRPNLKSVSQRILGFFANLRNTTKKLDESKLPSIDELFQTLNYIIECSTNHFNVINTLVEASMFCVKIIIYIANTSSPAQKEEINQKLISIYMELIKNEKIRANALIYKEFLIRHPEQSIPLVNKIIDSVDSNDAKVFKKTYALITLNQTINNQLFTKAGVEQGELLIKKIFSLLEKILDEIIKNDILNIKFVDAFLNLTQRALNLQKSLLNKQICENMASKLALLMKDTKMKQAHKSRVGNLIRICQNFDQNTQKKNKNK